MGMLMTKKQAREIADDLESVGGLTTYLLLTTDKPYSEIRDQVREKLESHTSRAVVRWYANSLRKAGHALPERPRSVAE